MSDPTFLKIVVSSGNGSRELRLETPVNVIGRAGDCQVKLDDTKSSRQHARISRTPSSWVLSDLDSGNGTRLNGSLITTEIPIARGDSIVVGATTILVIDMDLPDPAKQETVAAFSPQPPAAPPAAAPAAAAPPPPAEAEAPAIAAGFRKVLIGAGLAIAGLAALIVVMAMTQAATKVKPPDPSTVRRPEAAREADEALALFRQRAEAAAEVDLELLADARRLAARHNPAHRLALGPGATLPFDELIDALALRRQEKIDAALAGVTTRVNQALDDRRYSAAVAEIESFMKSAGPDFDSALRDLVDRADSRIRDDYAALRAAVDKLVQRGLYADAAGELRHGLARFDGTRYHPALDRQPEDFAAAATLAATPFVRPTPSAQPPTSPSPAPESLQAVGLIAKVAPAINAGRLKGRIVSLGGDRQGSPVSADGAALTVITAGKSEALPWATLAPYVIFGIARLALDGDDLLDVAAFGYARNLARDSDRLLLDYVGSDKGRLAKASAVIAKARGLASPPPGGYVYDRFLGWAETGAKEWRLAREEALYLIFDLTTQIDRKAAEAAMTRLKAILEDATLPEHPRASIRKEAIAAIRANKEERLKSLAEKAKTATIGFDKIRAAKVKLNQAREAALKLIYDEKIYVREDHPDWPKGDIPNGQSKVDELVDAVKALWSASGSVVVALDPDLRRDAELIKLFNEKYLPDLGEAPPAEELAEYDEVLSNLAGKVNLRTFSLNAKEAEQYAWNRNVDKYNAALKDPDVGESEKTAATVLNDYREMMGRRRLFLDAKLCRATKKHSAVCSAAGRIWHEGSDGSPQSRAQAEGFNAGVGENVAIGYADGWDIWWRGWYRASDHHRGGLAEQWTCMGYGFSGSVGTQNFSTIPAPF